LPIIGGTSGGRRPVPADINYEAHLALGFKLNRYSVECALTDLATSPLAAADSSVADTIPEGMIETIAATIPHLLSQSICRRVKSVVSASLSRVKSIPPAAAMSALRLEEPAICRDAGRMRPLSGVDR
jgi:hypothetical protein